MGRGRRIQWNDIRVDITPREYVLDYLAHSFPVQLYEPFTDSEGNLSSRPVMRDGQPVECREAARRRDALIEKLAALPPVPGALDQIVQRFGTDLVAEVTARSRRIVRKGEGPAARLVVESRAGSANLSETAAFMDDQKRILIFSDAGGTGRSYHADLGAKNQRLRVHYLLEPGWKADAAIQGLGRTNRTNQAQPPLFRPVATDVKAEKRFLSTIARRLDTLGAITRGQRQTGGQGLFRPEIAIPVHGERRHMEEHAKLAKDCGVPKAMVPINGSAIRLAPDGPKLISHEKAGRLLLDGDVILPADGATIVERRRMSQYGLIAVSVVVGKNGLPAATPNVSAHGVPVEEDKDDFLAECAEAAEKAAAKGDPKRPEHYAEAIRVAVRRVAREWTGKKPVTEVQVTRL